VLELTVSDGRGGLATCQTTITAEAVGDLWVELTWDVPKDLDLHLHNASMGGNVGVAGAGSAWMNNTVGADCYFSQTAPSWDGARVNDDPSLERDDTSGTGPDNIRINAPVTTHDYDVAVHHWSGFAGNTTATVRIYCRGTLVTTQTHTFTAKDMWVPGRVRMNAGNPACTFTPDGRVFPWP
jgi:uncharacterized protein YfaP (DUF2135 family)